VSVCQTLFVAWWLLINAAPYKWSAAVLPPVVLLLLLRPTPTHTMSQASDEVRSRTARFNAGLDHMPVEMLAEVSGMLSTLLHYHPSGKRCRYSSTFPLNNSYISRDWPKHIAGYSSTSLRNRSGAHPLLVSPTFFPFHYTYLSHNTRHWSSRADAR
jgi:hypothetical protein